MKIAQIAPLIESVPPRLYGGTERIVSYLTEALVAEGHDVTLFASADSVTSARLVPCSKSALRLDPAVRDPIPYAMLMLDKVRRMAHEFDILHFHIDQFHFPLFCDHAPRVLTTLHGRQDLPDLAALYEGFPQMPLVSISAAQRAPVKRGNFVATIPHGLPQDLYAPTLHPRGGYLAFLGRISPEKRVDRAIAIARGIGLPLRIAAKVDRADEAYFDKEIKPLLDQPGVSFVGEIGEREKGRFLGEARALLFPIDWPEPFGLVMIEAVACGTPVLAFRQGSVPEVIEEGVSGVIVDTVDEAICKMGALLSLPRGRVRHQFERRFTARRMAENYLGVYNALLAAHDHGVRDGRTRARAIDTRKPELRLPERGGSLHALARQNVSQGRTGPRYLSRLAHGPVANDTSLRLASPHPLQMNSEAEGSARPTHLQGALDWERNESR